MCSSLRSSFKLFFHLRELYFFAKQDNIYLRDRSQMSGKDLRYYGIITDFLQGVARELSVTYDMRFISPRNIAVGKIVGDGQVS